LAEHDTRRGVTYEDVDDDRAGQRLDNYLIARLRGVPRSLVYRLIRSGQVRVNSGRSSPAYRLKPGDKVRIPPTRQTAPKPPEPAGLAWLERRIVHEDDRIIVVDKPAGLAVHGGSGVSVGCIEALRSLRPHAKALELVHRLDRGTSGCLLVAKRRSALRALHALLREGGIEKRYLTLVKGLWPQDLRRVETTLARDPAGPGVKVRVAAEGKASISEFRLIAPAGRRASYLEVELETGRTHQIRVQAAHLGHPIAGDERYGDADFNRRAERLGLQRLFLHAHALAFTWPGTEDEFSIGVPLPEDLKRVLEAFSER
jgi:23S rRNA pseudouridine955/2504/2580 synthase